MKKTLIAIAGCFGVLVVAGIIIAAAVIGLSNNLVQMEEDVDNSWAKVETQYQRRFDLIPNLVASVKGYMEQEQKVFGDIADARTKYSGAESGSAEKVEAANEVESALGRLLVIMENYPELKSDETVRDLMVELEGTENRIAVERNRYNDEVTDFNKKIRVFPNSLINSIFLHFDEKERFESAEGADIAPTVDLQDDEEETEDTDTSTEGLEDSDSE
ncbi:LemA family protein [Candidatus Dojkabacteria bacterium]|nr:LemA family protein [Candidatus Dojkabacteria bacterium]